jgi:hypothetical protein
MDDKLLQSILADIRSQKPKPEILKKYGLGDNPEILTNIESYGYGLETGIDREKLGRMYPSVRARFERYSMPARTDFRSERRRNPDAPRKQPVDPNREVGMDEADEMFSKNFANSTMGKVMADQKKKEQENIQLNTAISTVMAKTNPMYAVYQQLVAPIFNTSQKAIGNFISGPMQLAGDIIGAAGGEQVEEAIDEKAKNVMDWWTRNQSDKAKAQLGNAGLVEPAFQQGGVFNDGKFNIAAVLPRTIETLTNMAALVGGGQAIGGKIGLMASSYLMTYEDSRQEALKVGLKGNQAEMYAAGNSVLQGWLELISPNDILFGKAKAKIGKELLSKLTNNMTKNQITKEMAKAYGKAIGAENIQEFSQLFAEKGLQEVYNRTVLEGQQGFDNSVDKDEVLETLLLTTLATGIISTPGIKSATQPSMMQQSAFAAAAEDFEGFQNILGKAIQNGKIDEQQAANITGQVEQYKSEYDKIKAAGHSEEQSARMAWASTAKGKLNEVQTELSQSPALAQTAAPSIQALQTELDGEIQDAAMGIPKNGEVVSGLDMVKLVNQIGDKGQPLSMDRAKEIGVMDYQMGEVDLENLYKKNRQFKNLADQYSEVMNPAPKKEGQEKKVADPEIVDRVKNSNPKGLRMPAIMSGNSVVDGMHRLAQQYAMGAQAARAFNALEKEIETAPGNIAITQNLSDGKRQEEGQEDVLDTPAQMEPEAPQPVEFVGEQATEATEAESSKAKIEKRRKEELSKRVVYDIRPTVEDGEFMIVGDPNQRTFRINENTGRPQVLDKSNGLWSNTEESPNMFFETTKRSGFIKSKDKINAKYDAELSALENTAKTKAPEAPLSKVQEYKLKDSSGRNVTVKYDEQGNRIIRLQNGRNLSLDNPKAKRILGKHAKNYNYNFGNAAEDLPQEDMPEGMSENDVWQWNIDKSENPSEVADLYNKAPKIPRNLSEKELAISRSGIEIPMSSYERWGDPNNMEPGKRLKYIRKNAKPADVLAKEISDETGLDITPEDIIDFVDDFPGGVSSALQDVDGPIREAAMERFEQLTGIPLTPEIADLAAQQRYGKEATVKAEIDLAEILEAGEVAPEEIEQAIKEAIAEEEQATGKKVSSFDVDDLESGIVDELDKQIAELESDLDTAEDVAEYDEIMIKIEELKAERLLYAKDTTTPEADQQGSTAEEDIKVDESADAEQDIEEDLDEIADEATGEDEEVGPTKTAPNGNPSNLNSRQWEQVRTPEFKAWFGDWENDPANASKVVDENGEPLVVYHGSPHTFDKFAESPGYYFTDDKGVAETYRNKKFATSPQTIEAFLNIRKLEVIDAGGAKFNEIPVVFNVVDGSSYKVGTLTTDEIVNTAIGGRFPELLSEYKRPDGVKINNVRDAHLSGPQNKSNIYIALHPNQIKSATGNTGVFSPNNDSIYDTADELEEELNEEIKGAPESLPAVESGPGLPEPTTNPISTKTTKANDRLEASKKAFKDAFKDFMDGKNNLGISADEDAKRQARLIAAGINLVGDYIKEGIYKFVDMVDGMADIINEYGQPFFDAFKKAYVAAYMEDVTGMMDDPRDVKIAAMPSSILDTSEYEATPRSGFKLAIKEAINRGEKLDIRKLRNIAERVKYDASDTDLQESVELALIEIGRSISQKNETADQRLADIIALYNRQPALNQRDSDKVALQQYSTPLPISFIAGHWLNLKGVDKVFEPTAGNGMMVVNIAADKIIANEIDPMRVTHLREQGIYTTERDATQDFNEPNKYDGVIMNPPFGRMEAVKFGEYQIEGLDEIITANALLTMKETGRAAIIIGGHMEYDDKGRIKGSERRFFNYIYRNYSVSDVVNIDGSLYSKQGTRFPIRMILINGISDGSVAAAPLGNEKSKQVVTSFEELFKRINAAHEGSIQSGVDSKAKPSNNIRSEGQRASQQQGGNVTVPSDKVPLSSKGSSTGGRGPSISSGNIFGDPDSARGGTRNVPARNTEQQSVSNASTSVPGRGNEGRGATNQDGGGSVNKPNNTPRVVESTVNDLLTKEKVPYVPQSKGKSLGTKIPSSMYAESRNALLSLQDEVGEVDAYVKNKLEYRTKDDLYKALSAEQIDAVALAIYNIDNGNAAIIGDMTGIGKGRIAASIIRYAVLQGKQPWFLTIKPELFSDMWRDLKAIGSDNINVMAISSEENGDVKEQVGDKLVLKFKALNRTEDQELKDAIKAREIPAKYNVVMMPYSQLQGDVVASGVRSLFQASANGNIVVLDEAHVAAGSLPKRKRKSDSGVEKIGLSRFMLNTLGSTQGLAYLSATYAKRPDNMPIYAIKTSMKEAGLTEENIAAAFEKGGTALQEVVSAQLVSEKQYIRREHEYDPDQISYITLTDSSGKDREKSDKVTEVIQDLIAFQERYVKPAIEMISNDLLATGGEAGITKGTENAGVDYADFASKTFNVINQMLLAIKAEQLGELAVKSIKENKKPVIALYYTMESMINEFAPGEELPSGDFNQVLKRGLDGVMRYTVKDGKSKKGTQFTIKPSQLSEAGSKAYYGLLEKIKEVSTGLPISPLDIIQEKIIAAGHTVKELTGRSTRVVERDGKFYTEKYPKRDMKQAVLDFQNGSLDAIIMNASASTGISLHADKDLAADKRVREMFLGQMQLDVNTEVQTRGRVDRTNQVQRGKYVYVISDIPAEIRTLVSFKKKMRSLDANTSANQNVKTSDINVVDFINKFGDLAVAEMLSDNYELNMKLMFPMANIQPPYRGLALKATGKVNLLPVKDQEAFYADVVQRYNEILEEKNALGENDLEVNTVDFKAKTLSRKVYKKGNGAQSAFGSDVIMETLEVDVIKKPLKYDQVLEMQKPYIGQDINEIREKAEAKFAAVLAQEIDEAKADYAERQELSIDKVRKSAEKDGTGEAEINKEIEAVVDYYRIKLSEAIERINLKITGQKNVTMSLLNRFRPGQKVMIPVSVSGDVTDAGQSSKAASPGLFLGFKFRESSKNPYTASNIMMQFVANDGRGRMPVKGTTKGWIEAIAEATTGGYSVLKEDIAKVWENRKEKVREEVFVMTGNLLKAVGEILYGKMIQFTTEDGSIRKGYLMNDGFVPEKLLQTVKPTSQDAMDQLAKSGELLFSEDGSVLGNIRRKGNIYELAVPKSKKSGGKFYLNSDLRDLVRYNNFYTIGNMMVAEFAPERLKEVLTVLDRLGLRASYDMPLDVPDGAMPKMSDIGIGGVRHQDLTDTKKALGKIEDYFKGDPQIERAVRFLKPIIASNPNIRVVEARPGEYTDPRVQALSYPDGTITLNYPAMYSEETLYRTLLHEMIHAATRHEIEKNPAFKAELESILSEVREALGLPSNEVMIATFMKMGMIPFDKYGATNAHEMVAEVFSNREFHNYLNQISYSGQTSLLQRIIDRILSFLSKTYRQVAAAKDNIETSRLADYVISLTEQVVSPRPAAARVNTGALAAMGPGYPVAVVKDFIRRKDGEGVDTDAINLALQGSLSISEAEARMLIEQALTEPYAKTFRQRRSQVADVFGDKAKRLKKAEERFLKKAKKAKSAEKRQQLRDEYDKEVKEIEDFGYGPELEDGQRQRGLTYRIAPGLDEDTRKNLDDDARVYFIKKNKVSLAEAEAFINQYATDNMFDWLISRPEVLDGVSLDQKVFIYGSAMKKLMADADAAKMDMDFDKAKELNGKVQSLVEALSPYATELGRAVQAFTILGKFGRKILPAYADGLIAQIEREIGRKLTNEEKESIKKLADDMKDAGEGLPQRKIAQQLIQILGNLRMEKVRVGELLNAIWYAHILSGPGTHVKNTSANFFNSAAEFMVKSFVELKKTRDIGVLPAMANAWWEGLGRGVTEARNIWQTGLTRETVQKFGQSPLFEWFTWESYLGKHGTRPTLEKIGRAMDTRWSVGFSPKNLKYVGRALAAADAMLYTANAEMASAAVAYGDALLKKQSDPNLKVKELYREIMGKTDKQVNQAKAQALAEGFDPSISKGEYKQRVYELIKQSRGEAINTSGDRYGAKVTFNHEPDGILRPIYDTLSNIHKRHVGFRYFVPFLRIVTNIMENWMTWGPIGAIKAKMGSREEGSKSLYGLLYFRKLSPDEVTEYYTKSVIGTSITMALLAAAIGDDDDDWLEISANGTGDIQKNYELQKSGWREYSIRIGGKTISYKDTPLFPMLAAVGKVADHFKFGNGDPNDASVIEYLTIALNGYAASLMDQSWMTGVDDLVSSFKSENEYGQQASIPEKFFAGAILNPAKSIIMSNFSVQVIRVTKEMLDQPIKRAHGVEKIYRDMPWLNGEWFSFGDPLNPIVDVWGEPVVPKSHLAWIPFKAEVIPPEDDPLNDFLAKKKIWVGRPERKEIFDGDAVRPMTDNEYYEYMKLSGILSKRNLKNMLDAGALQNMDLVMLRKAVESQRTQARQEAYNRLFYR